MSENAEPKRLQVVSYELGNEYQKAEAEKIAAEFRKLGYEAIAAPRLDVPPGQAGPVG